MVTTLTIIVIIIISLLLFKLCQKCKKSRKFYIPGYHTVCKGIYHVCIYCHNLSVVGANSKSQEVCGVTDNPAYETCASVDRLEPDYNMDNNPVYMINNNTTLQKTEIPIIYETIQ